MPTESTFLFAGLLFLAAALGYVFARFGDDEDDEQEASRTNFLRGFRYLLDEESDRAVDVFTGASDPSDEAMETQLALGTLFRRRGEMDRAIRLHQNLVDRETSSVAQRDAALFALAEDYLSAGLFDRAEELFTGLRGSREHGVEALRRLLRICEVSSEWDRAVDLCAELNRLGSRRVSSSQLAHYYCELAEQSRRDKAFEIAGQMLRQADAIECGTARAALIRADLDLDCGRTSDALAALSQLGRENPKLLGEVLPRLLAVASASGEQARVNNIVDELAATAAGLRGIALCVVRDPRISDPRIVRHFATFVAAQPALQQLVWLDEQADAPSVTAVQRLRPLLQQILTAGTQFQCSNCGYGSAAMQWQCPGCRNWDSVQPVVAPVLDGILRSGVSPQT